MESSDRMESQPTNYRQTAGGGQSKPQNNYQLYHQQQLDVQGEDEVRLQASAEGGFQSNSYYGSDQYAFYESHPQNAFVTDAQMTHANQQQKLGQLLGKKDSSNLSYGDEDYQNHAARKGDPVAFQPGYDEKSPVRQETPMSGTLSPGCHSQSHQQDLQNSGFITSYQHSIYPHANLSKQALNAQVLQAHRMVSHPTQPSSVYQTMGKDGAASQRRHQSPQNDQSLRSTQKQKMSPNQSQINYGNQTNNNEGAALQQSPTAQQKQTVFSKYTKPMQTSSSPMCRQRMSPRTIQPSSLGTTVPPLPSFTSTQQHRQRQIIQSQQQQVQGSQMYQQQHHAQQQQQERMRQQHYPLDNHHQSYDEQNEFTAFDNDEMPGYEGGLDLDEPDDDENPTSGVDTSSRESRVKDNRHQELQTIKQLQIEVACSSSDGTAPEMVGMNTQEQNYVLKSQQFLSFGVGRLGQSGLKHQGGKQTSTKTVLLQRAGPTKQSNNVDAHQGSNIATSTGTGRFGSSPNKQSRMEMRLGQKYGYTAGSANDSESGRIQQQEVCDVDLLSDGAPQSSSQEEKPQMRVFSKKESDDFIEKQREFERRKMDKINRAMSEKKAREQAELKKHATFKPKLMTAASKLSPQNIIRRHTSPKQRTLQQFISDQQNYQMRSQRKIDEKRVEKDIQEYREITGKPQLNPVSEQICQKIQADYFAQYEAIKEHEKSQNTNAQNSESQLEIGQEYPIQRDLSGLHSMSAISETDQSVPRTVNTSTITLARQTKKKKTPSNLNLSRNMTKGSTSPKAKQLLAQKKLLAKAVPHMPTFAPKINSKSSKLVADMQKREEARRKKLQEAQATTNSGTTQGSGQALLGNDFDKGQVQRRNIAIDMIGSGVTTQIRADESPIHLEERYEGGTRLQTEVAEYFKTNGLEEVEYQMPAFGSRNGSIKQARTTQAKTAAASNNTSQIVEKFPSSREDLHNASMSNMGKINTTNQQKSPLAVFSSRLRQEPRIAQVKAQTQQINLVREKKTQEQQFKKYNENLILRNFKKEFDAIMLVHGLGETLTEDLDQSSNKHSSPTLVRECSDYTQSTTKYFSAQSHEMMLEDAVSVDLASILFQLGFITSPLPQRRGQNNANSSCQEQFVCTLEDKNQKSTFKANLFIVLSAIQSINLKDHFAVYGTFGILQQHILEEITMMVDFGGSQYAASNISCQLGSANNAQQPRSQSNMNARGGDVSDSGDQPSQDALFVEALLQLATQPFPFSLNHSHLVKLHLTFMSLFLNRKDSISRGHRHSLEQQEADKYKYSPQISYTQQSFSPPKQRTPLNEPNRYYDELKRNIKERAAKMSSLKAEKERTMLDECTFKPEVNPKSTRIAYKQVAEMHLGQKEFTKTYMVLDENDPDQQPSLSRAQEESLMQQQLYSRRESEQPTFDASEDMIATVSATASATTRRIGNKATETTVTQGKTRIDNRINKLVSNYVQDKRAGKKQDISTEQKEYERSIRELTFRPNLAKTQINLSLACKKSPKSKNQQLLKKSPTGLKTPLSKVRSPNVAQMSNSAGNLKPRTIMFKQSSPTAKNEPTNSYSARFKQQIVRRKKSPIKQLKRSETSANTSTSLPKASKSTKSIKQKKLYGPHTGLQVQGKKSPPITVVNLMDPVSPTNIQGSSLARTQFRLAQAQAQSHEAVFPQTAETHRDEDYRPSDLGNNGHTPYTDEEQVMPEVTEYVEQVNRQDRRVDQMMFLREENSDSTNSLRPSEQHYAEFNSAARGYEDGSTADFIGTPQLGAPPSVADIQCYSNSMALQLKTGSQTNQSVTGTETEDENNALGNGQNQRQFHQIDSNQAYQSEGERLQHNQQLMFVTEGSSSVQTDGEGEDGSQEQFMEFTGRARDATMESKAQFLQPIEEESSLQNLKQVFDTPQSQNQANQTRSRANYQEMRAETSQQSEVLYSSTPNKKDKSQELLEAQQNSTYQKSYPHREQQQYQSQQQPLPNRQNHFASIKTQKTGNINVRASAGLQRTSTLEGSSDFPRNLLMPTNQSKTDDSSLDQYHQQSVNQQALSNSNVEWTSEFAKVVQDYITIDNTQSVVNRFTEHSQSGINNNFANTLARDQQVLMRLDKGSFESNPNKRMTQFSEPGQLQHQKFGAASEVRGIKSELQIQEKFSEEDQIYEEQVVEQEEEHMCGPVEQSSSSMLVQEQQQQEFQEMPRSDNNQSRQYLQPQQQKQFLRNNQIMEQSASTPQSQTEGRPYQYVNEGSSNTQSEEVECFAVKHQFGDSEINLGMLGQNLDHEEERLRSSEMVNPNARNRDNQHMPRIDSHSPQIGRASDMLPFTKKGTNNLVQGSDKTFSHPDNDQQQIEVEEPTADFVQRDDEGEDRSSFQEAIISLPGRSSEFNGGITPEHLTPKAVDFNNISDGVSEIRISNLEDYFNMQQQEEATPRNTGSKADQVAQLHQHGFSRADTEDIMRAVDGNIVTAQHNSAGVSRHTQSHDFQSHTHTGSTGGVNGFQRSAMGDEQAAADYDCLSPQTQMILEEAHIEQESDLAKSNNNQ